MGDIMNTWTLQPGFPLLRVSVSDASGVLISQERFLNNEVQVEGHINQDTGLYVSILSNYFVKPGSKFKWEYI